MADIRWRFPYKVSMTDAEPTLFEFNASTELTGNMLRRMQNWFGEQYGEYASVIAKMTRGDVNAWAAAIWICLKRDYPAKCPANPGMIDFPVGKFLADLEDLTVNEPEDEERPTQDDPILD